MSGASKFTLIEVYYYTMLYFIERIFDHAAFYRHILALIANVFRGLFSFSGKRNLPHLSASQFFQHSWECTSAL